MLEELVYGLKQIRDDYFKNEQDPIVVEIADDSALARFEIGVSVRMVHDDSEVHSLDVHRPTPQSTTKLEASSSTSSNPEKMNNNTVISEPKAGGSSEMAVNSSGVNLEDVQDENSYPSMVTAAKKVENDQTGGVVGLAVNMPASEGADNDLVIESVPTDYDESLYQDEEDLDPEVLERLKRDRKFYEEWKSRGRVPTLLSRNAAKQSDRRMGHSD